MQIRQADHNDIWIIQAIAQQVWPVTYNEILSSKQIEYMMEMMYNTSAIKKQMDDAHHFLLLCDEAEYTAFLSYELNYAGMAHVKIHKLYVLPSVQGKGYGRLLIDELERIALSNANELMMLNVNRNNKAIGFYKKIGFEISKTENIDIGNGFIMEDFVMTRKMK